MIGLLVIGPHYRLKEAYKRVGQLHAVSAPRLMEIDYAQPKDFKAILERLPERAVRWTNNLAVLDVVPLERVCVLTKGGPKPFLEHPVWAEVSGSPFAEEIQTTPQRFWLVFGENWQESDTHVRESQTAGSAR